MAAFSAYWMLRRSWWGCIMHPGNANCSAWQGGLILDIDSIHVHQKYNFFPIIFHVSHAHGFMRHVCRMGGGDSAGRS